MKKFSIKTRLGLLVVLGMLAFGFGATRASAQQLLNPSGTFSDGSISWLTSDDAQAALNQELANLDQLLKNSPDQALDLKRKFYYSILNLLEQGQTVPAALDGGYVKFVPGNTDMSVEVPNNLPVQTWKIYYDDAANMLQN